MKLLIAGSRTITAFDLAPHIPEDTDEIISGGAKGIDTLAEEYARVRGIPVTVIRPDYSKYGTAAPIKRNEIMVVMADAVLAVWDGVSKGSRHTIEYAKKRGKDINIITV